MQKKLSKEKSSIEDAVNKYAEYKNITTEIEGLKELVLDHEMQEIARLELDTKKEELEKITKELEILLLPKDENDGKDIIIVSDTLIMYANVTRQEKQDDGRYQVGIQAKKFTPEVLSYLFEHIGSELDTEE